MSDYDRSPDYFDLYDPQGIKCIDSAMTPCKPGTFNFLELKGLKDLQTGDYNDGRATYISLLNLHGLTPHPFAVNACCLSYIYEVKGPQEKSVQLLIRAAISDIPAPFESGKDYGKVYFPEGTWYCLYTGEKENGTQEKIIPLKINKLPVYVKGGSIIPMQSLIQTTAEQPTDTLYLHIYNGSEANR